MERAVKTKASLAKRPPGGLIKRKFDAAYPKPAPVPTPLVKVRADGVYPLHKMPFTPDDIVEARKVKYIGGRPREIGWSRPFPLPSPPNETIPPERRDEFNRLMSAVLDSPRIYGADLKRFQKQVKEFGLEQYFADLAEAEALARLLASGRPVKVHGSDVKRFQELMERLGVELPQPLHKQALTLEPIDQPIAPRVLTPKTRKAKRSTRKRRLSRFDYATTLKGFTP